MITTHQLQAITGRPVNANALSVIAGLQLRGAAAGLDRPHRLAHYLSQLCHESGAFRYDREVWGPTPAQARYDTRTDLGNTPEKDGDGERYKGRTAGQITGRANYAAFTRWARTFRLTAPDFVADPEAILTDPWEGLGPIWFWEVNNLNRYADAGDIEMVTRRINGGLNGYADRQMWYARAALVLLGRDPADVAPFQRAAGLTVDGVPGPRTRAALHGALLRLPALAAAPQATPAPANPLAALLALILNLLGVTK